MAAHRRRVAAVGFFACLSLLLGATALRALAQAPDREDYLLPADTAVACDDFLIGEDTASPARRNSFTGHLSWSSLRCPTGRRS
jgi:hypothetical protein